jgi:hypothetical protein
MAVLGCISAITTLGAKVTIPDVAIGGIAVGGITFVIASIIGSINDGNKNQNSSRVITSGFMNAGNYEFDISDEMKEFLDSLEIVRGRTNGWYVDPSNLYKLRFFHNGKWTLAVSDSKSEFEKSAAFAAFSQSVKRELSQTKRTSLAAPNPQFEHSTAAPDADIIAQIERLSALHSSGALNDSEFQQAKQILIQRL